MSVSFRLPDLGEGVHEAEILAIAVSPGQKVEEGQVILEVETDKAAVEIPSPWTGTVERILIKVGDMAVVGDELMSFITEGENSPAPQEQTAPPAEKPQPGRSQLPVPASPSTRRLARELGVDLLLVTPTGSGGIVTKEDVENYARQMAQGPLPAPAEAAAAALPVQRPSAPPPAGVVDFAKWGPVERRPFRSIRRATASQMTNAWTQIPHVHCQDSVDITKLEAFRQKHKAELAAAGGRLTMTVFAMKAVATALKTYPSFNASLDLSAQEIIVKNYYHIGIATNTDNGLLVPVIRDVDRKSIKELAIELHEVTSRVRTGKFSREQLQGGTFTITNAGALGGSSFSAIINSPEVAILGLGQGRMQAVVVTGEDGNQAIVPRLIMPIVLCFDHRVVDGADAIAFLRVVINALQDPDELLITMI